MTRLALLGAGRIGQTQASAVTRVPDAIITAVFDPVENMAMAAAPHAALPSIR